MAKTFMQDGKWIDNPKEVVVLACSCGNKYIQTRPKQMACIPCLAKRKCDA